MAFFADLVKKLYIPTLGLILLGINCDRNKPFFPAERGGQ